MPNDDPKVQPQPAVADVTDVADDDSGFDWGKGLDVDQSGFDGGNEVDELLSDLPEVEAPATSDVPASPPADAAPKADDPAQTPPAAPSEPVKEETPAVTPPVEPAAATTPAQPENLQSQFEDWFNRSADTLAKEVYKISPDDAEAIAMGDADKVAETLSKLAGRLHMQSMTAAFTQVMNALPQMVPQITEQAQRRQSNEEEFYTEYPELKAHANAVNAIAVPLANASPGLGREELKQRIAAAAAMAVGVVPAKLQKLQAAQPVSSPVSQPVPPTSAVGGVTSVKEEPLDTWTSLVRLDDE